MRSGPVVSLDGRRQLGRGTTGTVDLAEIERSSGEGRESRVLDHGMLDKPRRGVTSNPEGQRARVPDRGNFLQVAFGIEPTDQQTADRETHCRHLPLEVGAGPPRPSRNGADGPARDMATARGSGDEERGAAKSNSCSGAVLCHGMASLAPLPFLRSFPFRCGASFRRCGRRRQCVGRRCELLGDRGHEHGQQLIRHA